MIRLLLEGMFGWKKAFVRQVSNLRGPRETDFDSAVITTWLRPVRRSIWGNHPWVNVKVYSDRKTLDFSRFRSCAVQQTQILSLVGRGLLAQDQLKNTSKELSVSVSSRVLKEKKLYSLQVSNLHWHRQRDRFRFCCIPTLARATWDQPTRRPSTTQSSRRVLIKKKSGCRQVSNLRNLGETDFNSVVLNTCLRPVTMLLKRNHPCEWHWLQGVFK
jgi:hypothetical protein